MAPPEGQIPLTGLDVAMVLERLTGLSGEPPTPAGLYFLYQILEPLSISPALNSLAEGPKAGGAVTRYELLNLLVSAISSAAVAVTVLYAAWQARAAREQSAVLSAQVVAEQQLALDRVFVERPELRPYFYDAQPLDGANADTRARALAVAELTLDVFQLALTGGGRYSALHRLNIHAWILRSFARSPALRAKLRADRALYNSALIRLLEEAEAGSITSSMS